MFLDSSNYLDAVSELLSGAASVDIAVAFWGSGAEKLILQHDNKMRVICNLTSGGTNPAVIRALQGPNREIRHLQTLHAKVVLGDNAAIIGSANFSTNGLHLEGDELIGWQEAGMSTKSKNDIAAIQKWFLEQWHSATPVTDELLKKADEDWKSSRINRVAFNKDSSILSTPISSFTDRNLSAVIYREKYSEEAKEVGNNRIKESIAKESGKSPELLTFYEDWSTKKLKKGMIIIDVYIGKTGKLSVTGPYEIIRIEKTPRQYQSNKGKNMTLHYAVRHKNLLGTPSKEALKEVNRKKIDKDTIKSLLRNGDEPNILPIGDFIKILTQQQNTRSDQQPS